MAFDFFLSYARDDDAVFVARLYERLVRKGRRVWWDREHMPSRGTTFLQEIREAIADADRLVVVLGPAALTSEYVRPEWQYALSLSKPVTPLLCGIGAQQLPPELRLFHAPIVGAGQPSRRAWAEIDRVLAEPLPQLAALDGVPRIPPRFQPPPEIEALTGLLLGEQQRVENPRADDQVVAVAGLAGIRQERAGHGAGPAYAGAARLHCDLLDQRRAGVPSGRRGGAGRCPARPDRQRRRDLGRA